jgi:hypothetical protein
MQTNKNTSSMHFVLFLFLIFICHPQNVLKLSSTRTLKPQIHNKNRLAGGDQAAEFKGKHPDLDLHGHAPCSPLIIC